MFCGLPFSALHLYLAPPPLSLFSRPRFKIYHSATLKPGGPSLPPLGFLSQLSFCTTQPIFIPRPPPTSLNLSSFLHLFPPFPPFGEKTNLSAVSVPVGYGKKVCVRGKLSRNRDKSWHLDQFGGQRSLWPHKTFLVTTQKINPYAYYDFVTKLSNSII